MKVRNMVLISLFAALIAICAWIALPLPPVAFTLQTFGILMALGVLGGKRGTAAIGLYLALGFLGLPVFAGFRGGAGAPLDATGGFLWGFVAGGLACWGAERLGKLPGLVLCQLAVYLCGILWFSRWAGCTLWAAALTCVVPYLVFDAIKLWLAYTLSARIRKHI